MNSPHVSILMPVRNESVYLPATLDSLYRQSLTDWELVIVDDGSTDRTPLIIADAAEKDPRIRPLKCVQGGLVSALNEGLATCSAPLIARMDGDDIAHPRRLELQAALMAGDPDLGLVASSFRHFPRTGLKQGMLSYETWQNSLLDHDLIMRDLFIESPFVHPGVMMRSDLLQKLGGYRDCGWPEDYDLWLRMARCGTRFARLPQTLLFWRDHPERATRTMDEYSLNAFRLCKFHHLSSGYLAGSSRVVIAGAGREGRAWQRLVTAHGMTISCWLDVDPRKIGRQLHAAPVIHPRDCNASGDKIIVAIGARAARDEFRKQASRSGLREGLDFLCVA